MTSSKEPKDTGFKPGPPAARTVASAVAGTGAPSQPTELNGAPTTLNSMKA